MNFALVCFFCLFFWLVPYENNKAVVTHVGERLTYDFTQPTLHVM